MAKRLRSQEQERQEQTQIINLLSSRAEIPIRKEITRAVKQIMNKFRFTGSLDPDLILEHKQKMFSILEKAVGNAVDVAGTRQFNQFKKSHGQTIITKQEEEDPDSGVGIGAAVFAFGISNAVTNFNRNAANFASGLSTEQSNLIGNTTIKEIANEINRAQVAQDEVDREFVIDEVNEKVGKKKSSSRAVVIALTVIHTSTTWASQASTESVANELDLLMRKEWITAGDGDVREEHMQANGQLRAIHDPFLVGGEFLQRPGDPAGSAANIINCRCILGYIEIPK